MRLIVPFLKPETTWKNHKIKPHSLILGDREFHVFDILHLVGFETEIIENRESEEVLRLLEQFSVWTALNGEPALTILNGPLRQSELNTFNLDGPTVYMGADQIHALTGNSKATMHSEWVRCVPARDEKIRKIGTALSASPNFGWLAHSLLRASLTSDPESAFVILFAGLETFCKGRRRSESAQVVISKLLQLTKQFEDSVPKSELDGIRTSIKNACYVSTRTIVREALESIEETPAYGFGKPFGADELYRLRNDMVHRNKAISINDSERLLLTVRKVLEREILRADETEDRSFQ